MPKPTPAALLSTSINDWRPSFGQERRIRESKEKKFNKIDVTELSNEKLLMSGFGVVSLKSRDAVELTVSRL